MYSTYICMENCRPISNHILDVYVRISPLPPVHSYVCMYIRTFSSSSGWHSSTTIEAPHCQITSHTSSLVASSGAWAAMKASLEE